MTRLGQFIRYCQRVCELSRIATGIKDGRPYPEVPILGIWLSLVLGAVMRVPSFLQLEAETARACWQRWIGRSSKISDAVFGYATERMDLENLRANLVFANKTLKRNEAFEGNKIGGLLVASLDANEQFKSRSRCCPDCREREIKIQDGDGKEQTVIEYYPKQVYCQSSGPHLSSSLDVEPQRAGAGEAATALRLLTRVRENYGPRFLARTGSRTGRDFFQQRLSSIAGFRPTGSLQSRSGPHSGRQAYCLAELGGCPPEGKSERKPPPKK